MPVFTDLSSLAETYEESIIIPCLEGIDCVAQWCRVDLGCRLSWGGIQLGGADSIPIISFISGWLSVITFPPASVVAMVWQTWMVGIGYTSKHHSPLAPTVHPQ